MNWKFWKSKNMTAEEKAKEPLPTGRVSVIPTSSQTIRQSLTVVTDILTELSNNTFNKYKAMDVIVDKTPDGKMALNVYMTLTNNGGSFVFKDATTGTPTSDYDEEFRLFCERVGNNDASGLDGINESLVRSLYTRGAMALEIVIEEDMSDIKEIAIIDPSTLESFIWNDELQRYEVYQTRDDGQSIDLYTGNFMYIPYQPSVGSPLGTLKFEPAIVASTLYYQLQADSTTVLNRVAYARFLVELDTEAILNTANQSEIQTPEARNELLSEAYESVRSNLAGINRDSDIITFKENHVSILGGGVNGAGIDVRAWFELLDPLLCNAFQLPPVMLNRQSGGSYALGTAEYQSLIDGVDKLQLDLKRMNEKIANTWARVKGYSVVATYTPTPHDWQKLKEKWEAKTKELEFYRKSEEYGYISKDAAAQKTHNVSKADNTNSEGLYEYLINEKEVITNE